MAAIGWEVVAIAGVIIVLLIRPKTVPDLAKSFGQAIKSFREGKEEIEKAKEEIQST